MQFHLCPQKKYSLRWADFHASHLCSTALCADLLYQISTKSDNTCGNCGTNFTYATNVATFTKPTIIQPIVLWTAPVPNFIQIRQKCRKYQQDVFTPPSEL
jgi:hypothetical protein